MNTLRFAFVNFARDWKSGEQAVMAMALLVAVAALTAIAFFTNRIALGVEQQAGEVLAADIRIESQAPYYEPHEKRAAELNLLTARTMVFPTVIYYGERSVLTALRAVSPEYPLRGRMKLSRSLDGAVEEVQAAPPPGEVWADARMLAQLDADVGDRIDLGSAQFTVTRVLIARPDVGSQFAEMLPGAIFSLESLPATELIKPGSRPAYAMLFAGTPAAVTQFKDYLKTNRQTGERVTNIADASPQLRESIDRAGSFLNLASMVSVLLSAIAVAMAARRYAARRMDVVALMKSMGASQARVLTIYVTQLLIIALLATGVGTLIGYLAQEGLAWLLKDLLRGELPAPTFEPALLGLATAFTVLIGFALPPLLQLRKVPPVRVLRHDVGAPPLHNLLIYGLAIGAVIAVVATIVRDAKLVQQVVLGLAGTFVTLYFCGLGLVRALAVVRGRVGVSWRYGVANIARRGRESVVQVVAFGLGLMVLLLLIIVRNDLLSTWRNSLPTDAPNQFIINIQPSKVDEVREFFVAQGLAAPTLSPMASARMTHINDVPIVEWRARYRPAPKDNAMDDEDAQRASERARNASERQANLSWVEALPEGNKIVQGKWWGVNDGGGPRLSVEAGMAAALHVKVGDRISYDFAGETITATIASLREVKWDSFRPNYFIVFSPGVIDHAVGTYITSTHVPPEKRATMREFMRRFPEVTAIDIDAAIAQVRSVMDKVSLAVEYVSAFTLFAGITVLFAAIQSTRDERRYESAMLRTLGASRRVVLLGVASEFGVLGILSGVLAAAGATLVGYLLAIGPFNLEYSVDATVWIAGMFAGIALVGIVGTLATYSVVNAPPVETLRRGA
jgi:putative ABC transport system permease protein